MNGCDGCRNGALFEVPITMAFHPIVDIRGRRVFGYEALLRGVDGAGPGTIFSLVSDANRYAFDQKCRVTAIELAQKLRLADDDAYLSINFLPNAVYEPRACIKLTIETALKTGYPPDRIMFEFSEVERMDADHILNILRCYENLGFKTAIDDFGAGYSGLKLLSEFQPDIVKLDMDLVRDVEKSTVKQSIVRDSAQMLQNLGIDVVCEGIETVDEYRCLQDMGIELMQGFLFGKPAFQEIRPPIWPDDEGPKLVAISA